LCAKADAGVDGVKVYRPQDIAQGLESASEWVRSWGVIVAAIVPW
jgi:hypothetical protein